MDVPPVTVETDAPPVATVETDSWVPPGVTETEAGCAAEASTWS